MIRAVLSDLGNVLVHFSNLPFLEKLSRDCPYSVEEIRQMAFRQAGLLNAFDRGALSPAEFYDRAAALLGLSMDRDAFFVAYNDVFSLNMRAVDVLMRAKAQCRLVLLSNTDPMRFGFVRRRFPEVLFFDAYVLSFEQGAMKPEPAIYEEALRQARARAEECVLIDDLPQNIEAAERLRIKGILYEAASTDLPAELGRLGLSL